MNRSVLCRMIIAQFNSQVFATERNRVEEAGEGSNGGTGGGGHRGGSAHPILGRVSCKKTAGRGGGEGGYPPTPPHTPTPNPVMVNRQNG